MTARGRGSLLRDRGERTEVSTVELIFDLVYVARTPQHSRDSSLTMSLRETRPVHRRSAASLRVRHVCMARLKVYVPDELAARARERGLNVSALTQAAISAELAKSATGAWLEGLGADRTSARHEAVLDAIDAAREELGA